MQSYKDGLEHNYDYWKHKPVMTLTDKYNNSSNYGEIVTNIKSSNNPTNLPGGFRWTKININSIQDDNDFDDNNQFDMIAISHFLTKHYRRGTNSDYTMTYDPEYLKWQFNNTGHFMVILDRTDNIAAVIGYTVRRVMIHDKNVTMTEPLYMCCDPKYKNKGISKVLIDETIRQSAIEGYKYGIFCDNVIVPSPVATIRCYSRPLNYKKLKSHEFITISNVDDNLAHDKTRIKLKPNKNYVTADKTESNISIVHNLYNEYMKSFNIHMIMTANDIENYFFNDKYVKTMIVMDDKNVPIDFISYNYYDIYHLDEMNKSENVTNTIRAANILMYSSINVRSDVLFINAFKQMSWDKCDIVYINDMMHSNEAILSNVKNADEDTDDEEENACYDMNIVRVHKKTYINLFNWKCNRLRQNMISWLLY